MLPRKSQIQKANDDSSWIEYFNSAYDNICHERLSKLESDTINNISDTLHGKSVCVGWCGGGKDSVVIYDLMKRSGVTFTPVFWRGINEYPEVKLWIDENKPDGLVEITIGKFTLEFLDAHPGYLFVEDKKTTNKWMEPKWKAQRDFIKDFDLFVAGRRLKDGNNCGKRENNFIRNNTYSPIADWSHEELFAYIRKYNLELSPFYFWPRGFMLGSLTSGEWTERKCLGGMTVNDVWDEIWEIDKSIIYDSSEKLASARNYLEENHAD